VQYERQDIITHAAKNISTRAVFVSGGWRVRVNLEGGICFRRVEGVRSEGEFEELVFLRQL
jgi:hypothetical protein